MNCARFYNVCHRLAIGGITLSVLDGDSIFDYQGPLSIEALYDFVDKKAYLRSSRARKIWHVRSAIENLEVALSRQMQ